MYAEIRESDLVQIDNEEEATYVKILGSLRPVPVTIGRLYRLYNKKTTFGEELYIEDDNGNENYTFWICCKKEFYK